MAMHGDFDGFNIDAIDVSGESLPEARCVGFTDEEFFANFGINPDGTPLRRRGQVAVEQLAPISSEFAEAQADAMRGLASSKREIDGLALAKLVADLTIARAAASSRLAAAEETWKAEAIPPVDLTAPPTLPAAAAGYNLTPRIVPSPRP